MDVEYSKIYGLVMEDRHESDYELEAPITKKDAEDDLAGAEKFVDEIEAWLKREKWL